MRFLPTFPSTYQPILLSVYLPTYISIYLPFLFAQTYISLLLIQSKIKPFDTTETFRKLFQFINSTFATFSCNYTKTFFQKLFSSGHNNTASLINFNRLNLRYFSTEMGLLIRLVDTKSFSYLQ